MSINDHIPPNPHPVRPPWIPKYKSSIKPPYIPPPKQMSQPKRYDCGMKEETHPDGWNQRWPWMHPSDDGPWVKWEDYADLAADYVEVKDLHLKCRIDIGNLHKENDRLKAEVEWLRKADRLVCWNPATEQWEVRHEAPK